MNRIYIDWFIKYWSKKNMKMSSISMHQWLFYRWVHFGNINSCLRNYMQFETYTSYIQWNNCFGREICFSFFCFFDKEHNHVVMAMIMSPVWICFTWTYVNWGIWGASVNPFGTQTSVNFVKSQNNLDSI